MSTHSNAAGDIIHAVGPVASFMENRGYAPIVPVVSDAELKGAALDARLDELDLPKSGTADEKRARIVEYLTDTGADESEDEDPSEDDSTPHSDQD